MKKEKIKESFREFIKAEDKISITRFLFEDWTDGKKGMNNWIGFLVSKKDFEKYVEKLGDRESLLRSKIYSKGKVLWYRGYAIKYEL